MAWKRLQFQCIYQDSELNHSMKNGRWKILRKDRLLYLASSKLPHKLSNRGSRMSCIVHPTHPQQVQFHLAQKKRRTWSSPREVLLLEWQTTGAITWNADVKGWQLSCKMCTQHTFFGAWITSRNLPTGFLLVTSIGLWPPFKKNGRVHEWACSHFHRAIHLWSGVFPMQSRNCFHSNANKEK